MMMIQQRTLVFTLLAAGAAAAISTGSSGCISQPNGTPVTPEPATPGQGIAKVRELPPSGPQSFTPDAKPKGRSRAVTQLWSTYVGKTDHRTTVVSSRGSIYVGTSDGLAVIDSRSGGRKVGLPAAKGNVVGIAVDSGSGGETSGNRDRVYSSSAGGEVVGATPDGALLFRAQIGAAATTPPTLVDVDNDGKLEIAVGDAKGKVTLFDATTGKRRWVHDVDTDGDAPIGGGLAAADVDGDGSPEIIAGTESGSLVALRGTRGDAAWTVKRTSALRAAPIVADVDADKTLEVIVGWADGDVAIIDGKLGKEIWSTHVEEDDGDPTGLLASPTPVPNMKGTRVGALLVPTARWGKEDCVILLNAHDRSRRSEQGRVVTSPVLGTVDPGADGMVEAIVGTEGGDIVSFDGAGGFAHVYRLPSGITAPVTFVSDLKSDGTQGLLVLTKDGKMTALALHVAVPPLAGRSRGGSRNDGVFPAIDLGWKLP